ncbi:astacin-like metalloendopeptidase [Anomaloglossus baeobatrachus]|uniref:astacin-like metalloendopeptidase n=1 Tax=Anomaloglossus baeobatrachus TaxID=238106 RepID=UPI003F50BB7F
MELRLVLLSLLGCSLSWAVPVQVKNDATSTAAVDDKTLYQIFKEVNKDSSMFLKDGDINVKISRNVVSCPSCLWKKSADGIVRVPYTISPSFLSYEGTMITLGMKEFEVMTCVNFVNRTTEQDYLSIEPGGGCWSYIGKVGGKQVVSLITPTCLRFPLVQHELMHALGFYHEHTRTDRDKYIDILWQNISPNDYSNFIPDTDGILMNLPYAYNSVLHYASGDYSNVPGQPSMVAKIDHNMPLGQSVAMNNFDVGKVNTVYNCNLCRRKFVELSGTFTFSPTSTNQGGSNCLYLFQNSQKVQLQLDNINIPSSSNCNDAYIKIYDGNTKSSPVLVNNICGKIILPPLISSGFFMLVEIVTNQPSAKIAFSGSYQSVRYGGTFVSTTVPLTSPLFPNMYPPSLNIFYSIIAPVGNKVTLTFDFFRTLFSPTCSTEYLIIRDGPFMTSPILSTFCGLYNPPPGPVSSTGNIMVLQMQTADVTGFNGFFANIAFVPI